MHIRTNQLEKWKYNIESSNIKTFSLKKMRGICLKTWPKLKGVYYELMAGIFC